MPTKKKVEFVEELREKFARCTIAVATDYTGIGVNTMTELRRAMRDKQVEYRVVKNTLTYLAADSADRPQIKDIVQGPTALAFGYEDPVTVAKALEEYIRVNRSVLTIRGAVLDGRTLSSADVNMLANLPPKPQLVAQLLSQTQAPLSGLLSHLQAPLYGLLGALNGTMTSLGSVLQQRVEQLQAQGEAG